MFNNPYPNNAKDAARIHLDDPSKVNYWLRRYKISLEGLRAVISTIGSSVVVDVEKYLATHNYHR